jgi:hypothetical protein
MSDTSANLHMLLDRPIVERDPETYPSFTISNLPRTEIGASFTLSLTGTAAERRAFAAELRSLADFIEEWVRPPITESDELIEEAVEA